MHLEAASNRTIGEEFWSETKKDLAADLERAEPEVEMANGGGQGSQEEMREDLGDLSEEKLNYVVLVGQKAKFGGRVRELYGQAGNETYYMNGENHTQMKVKSMMQKWKIQNFGTS